ncbi:nuclear transport factor 2 family protein [Catenuloplanes sp. NPDC051500]|uniref:nuclear transport factor 2 family protein n=1 Tax=Catenuloplanes sp. NPDC051500 TaxID=3363959 RepID=UPI0037B49AFE
MSDLMDRYLAVWNETDAGRRRKLVEATFAPGCRYVDPLTDVRGTEALDAAIGAAQAQLAALFPGEPLRPVGAVDAHHDVMRFRWGVGGADPAVIGFDVLVVDERGLVSSVAGFFDRFPAAG